MPTGTIPAPGALAAHDMLQAKKATEALNRELAKEGIALVPYMALHVWQLS